jgi:hypothetical protein
MECSILRKCILPLLALAFGGCTTPAPFPLLGEAQGCIEAAESEGQPPVAQSATAPFEKARALLAAARRESDRKEARHFAHLALQQCRTARALARAQVSEVRLEDLDRIRIHLESALRVLQAEAAQKEGAQLASRLGIGHGSTEPGLVLPMARELFGRGGHGLRPRAAPVVGEIAEFLRKHRQWQVNIGGVRSAQAQRAAGSLRHSLIARGLKPERIRLHDGLDEGFVRLAITRPH